MGPISFSMAATLSSMEFASIALRRNPVAEPPSFLIAFTILFNPSKSLRRHRQGDSPLAQSVERHFHRYPRRHLSPNKQVSCSISPPINRNPRLPQVLIGGHQDH